MDTVKELQKRGLSVVSKQFHCTLSPLEFELWEQRHGAMCGSLGVSTSLMQPIRATVGGKSI